MSEKILPHGWASTTLGSIQEVVASAIVPMKTPEQIFELYSVPSHQSGRPEFVKGREIGSNKQTVTPNTVLLCKINPRINRVWVVAERQGLPQIASTEWITFAGVGGIEPQYLAYFLQQNLVRDFLAANASGVGGSLMRVKSSTLRDFPFQIAPTNEQSRIVAKIEELFSNLDAGVADLERAKVNLKRYRAAVLKAAVDGKLTKAWRTKHPNTETSSKLLARILTERQKRWEADQLAKIATAKKEPTKNWRQKYIEPKPPNTTGLPDLPEGWCWTTLDQLLTYLRNGYFQSPSGAETGTPILRINAVRPMSVDLAETRYLDEINGNVDDFFIQDGDLLFTRYNGSIDLLGVAGMVRGCTDKVLHPDKLVRVKLALGEPLQSFIEIAANVGASRKHMVGRARTTAGQTGISGPDIREMPIPLPPLDEQKQIVAEIAEKLSQIAAAETAIENGLLRGSRLRQSILKQAFEGKLVLQDPTDEPASMLLARLRENMSVHEGNGKNAPFVRRSGRRAKSKRTKGKAT